MENNRVIKLESYKKSKGIPVGSSVVKIFGKKYIMKNIVINRYKTLGYILFTLFNITISWAVMLYIINNIFN